MSEDLFILLDVLQRFERHVASDEVEFDIVSTIVIDEPRRSQQETETILPLTPEYREITPSPRKPHLVVLFLCQIGDSSSQVDQISFFEIPRSEHSNFDETCGIPPRSDCSQVLFSSCSDSASWILVSIRLVESDSAIWTKCEDVTFGVI